MCVARSAPAESNKPAMTETAESELSATGENIAEPVLRTTGAQTRFEAEWQAALKVVPPRRVEYAAFDAALGVEFAPQTQIEIA
jgi:hypothetical protein